MVLSKCTGGRVGCIVSSRDGASVVDDGASPVRGRSMVLSSLLAAVSTVALSTGAALAAGDTPSRPAEESAAVKALMAKINSMEQRINGLQAELKEAKSGGSKSPSVGQSASQASRRPTDAVALADPKDIKASGQKTADNAPSASKDTGPSGSRSSDNAQSSVSPVSRLVSAFADSDSGAKFMQAADLHLKAPPPGTNKDLFGVAPSPVPGMKIGMYGEIKFGSMQNPAANGQWQNGFDMGRLVLLPTYQVNDNITFNAELEWEHGGTAFDNDDKLHGTVEVEQAFFDIKFNDYFTLRAPGVDLVPISFNNLYHEPTLFYSVQRPELANGLIPTTWYAPAAGFYGKIVDGLNYQFQISQSAEDYGDSFDKRGDNGAIISGGYDGGVNGADALGLSHAPIGDFRQLSNEIAYTFRLSYTPSFLPGFAGSSAVYYSPNITPRGAYATVDDGNGGVIETPLGKNAMFIFDTEARYRVPNTGLEVRGEYAYVNFSNPENLRANNDLDDTNNVGKNMWGYSGEIAYHFKAPNDYEVVPFYRYTRQNLQTGGVFGFDPNNPTGSGDMTFHDVGVAVFPNPSLVFKLNYTKVIDHSPTGAMSDQVLAGVGWLW
jgi:phosphate-selective porin O/P